jgi:NAD(P)-dependent dehydrogenase (short-subunit alcohol dehydrogenase family)
LNKDEIASSYMEIQKRMHGDAKLPSKRDILITGVSDNNIGLTISKFLAPLGMVTTVDEFDYDFRSDMEIMGMFRNFGKTDTLVLCHGFTKLDWIEDQTNQAIDKMIDVSLTSHIKLISAFANLAHEMPYKKTIIVIGSMAATAVLNGSAPYCAAKAGLQHFVKCVAWELAPKGFDVFLINPSNVQDSPMSEATIRDLARYRDISLYEAREYWANNNPRNEFLSKDEIGELCHDLAIGKFPYLSGTPLNLTGGQR